jgi:hypothetical protein
MAAAAIVDLSIIDFPVFRAAFHVPASYGIDKSVRFVYNNKAVIKNSG